MTEEQKRKKDRLLEEWTRPSVIFTLAASVFGGIVWGVQLNMNAVENGEQIGKLIQAIEGQSLRVNQIEHDLILQGELTVRQSLILDRLERRLERAENKQLAIDDEHKALLQMIIENNHHEH